MNRKLFYLATAVFWLGILGICLGSSWRPNQAENTAAIVEKRFKLTEVALHAKEGDCWMAINGKVYDLTAYLSEHPSRPADILPWCGKEASEAYRTKTKGRPHSSRADQLLEMYQIGLFQSER
ncbi:MAG TPA: cytochrome b5-like heme/steroid binding domain-containing protein [Burkholderiales bacterium]|jgi:cytochrome b involved in lipid metabolism|nr:cytochrome b5-like heme/steroid binding domain-containing protein [Burkholderiales bacterium]